MLMRTARKREFSVVVERDARFKTEFIGVQRVTVEYAALASIARTRSDWPPFSSTFLMAVVRF
jgi:hypothetical protein